MEQKLGGLTECQKVPDRSDPQLRRSCVLLEHMCSLRRIHEMESEMDASAVKRLFVAQADEYEDVLQDQGEEKRERQEVSGTDRDVGEISSTLLGFITLWSSSEEEGGVCRGFSLHITLSCSFRLKGNKTKK
ncbi:hypothetical protein AMELA_G00285340 [Ameiurus melas]|uniref:Uncharacterized protein n=1 Tax=Ameiurus melas TaxID=219545 RepID=A0A7J5ZIY5_AMEME|nr:hypothetical protein AMELA_G00285340 [Ameiurus melas]